MIFRLLFAGATLLLLLTTCQPTETAANAPSETELAPAAAPPTTPAQQLLQRTVAAHGGDNYAAAHYQFVFRGKTYTFRNAKDGFTYTVTQQKDGATQFDQLTDGVFTREIDGAPASLTAKETASGAEALNSVIYFATLPHKLQDPAVNLHLAASQTIKGQQYDVLDVNFDEEGGGTDHDDNFRYWVNQQTHRIDYLAYDYRTNGGGVRFRAAFNPRVVDGILFQDYVNYKAPVGTALEDLPASYEAGQLEELSIVATESVVSLD